MTQCKHSLGRTKLTIALHSSRPSPRSHLSQYRWEIWNQSQNREGKTSHRPLRLKFMISLLVISDNGMTSPQLPRKAKSTAHWPPPKPQHCLHNKPWLSCPLSSFTASAWLRFSPSLNRLYPQSLLLPSLTRFKTNPMSICWTPRSGGCRKSHAWISHDGGHVTWIPAC